MRFIESFAKEKKMRAEVKVKLKKTQNLKSLWQMKNLSNEPQLRQHLVLAHQIRNVLEKNPSRTLREISEWLGLTGSRISQILNLLFLSPMIQQEILCLEKEIITSLPEHQIRPIIQELDWNKQLQMWHKLLYSQKLQ